MQRPRSTSAKGSSLAPLMGSTPSDGSGADCLEVAAGHPDLVPVRDSKNRRGPKLAFRAEAWTTFVDDLKQPSDHSIG